MRSSRQRVGDAEPAVAEPFGSVDRAAFERAVQRRVSELGIPEVEARFITSIEFGLLPEGDIVTIPDDEEPANQSV